MEKYLPLCTHGSLSSNTSIVKRWYVCEPHSINLKLVHARHMSNASIELKTDEDVVRFNIGNQIAIEGSQKKGKKTLKRHKLSRKAKINELRFFRLKAKKKMNSPNPEVRIRYKLEKVSETKPCKQLRRKTKKGHQLNAVDRTMFLNFDLCLCLNFITMTPFLLGKKKGRMVD